MASFDPTQLFSVRDMVFIITGAGAGMGRWMAEALDANGAAKVFILGRRLPLLEEVASNAANKSIIPIQCDITSKDSLLSAVAKIEAQTPYVNAVIANAGLLGHVTTLPSVSGEESIDEIYDQLWNLKKSDSMAVVETNLVSVYYTLIAFLRLVEAGNTHALSPGKLHHIQSQFLVISSEAAITRRPAPNYVYASSKAASVHLTKNLSTGFAMYGIRANCIAPGIFVTEMTKDWLDEKTMNPGGMPKESFPATRTGTPEDIAGTVLYLCSKAGAYVNGAVLVLDGGQAVVKPGTY